jgi:hypothetical protein
MFRRGTCPGYLVRPWRPGPDARKPPSTRIRARKRIGWSIVFVAVTMAINSMMNEFVRQTPEARRDIIKLVKALRRRQPKP